VVAHILAFLGVAAVIIVTPGPDTALTVRNTLLGGKRSGALTAVGVSAGQACWTLAASAGVVALLQASEPAFLALRLAGAAYLIFLGAQALIAAFRGSDRPVVSAHGGSLAGRRAFRQGLISNLGNPKMAVFFTSLLPQFGGASFVGLLLFGLLFCAMTLAWLGCYAVAVARAGDFFRRRRIRRTLEGVTGAVLVALGLRLAAEHR
jgi:threonine/homoserine/homoserine lactone efflux protein